MACISATVATEQTDDPSSPSGAELSGAMKEWNIIIVEEFLEWRNCGVKQKLVIWNCLIV